MKRTDKKGFTIVELVIVIAVIAILAAVLIPNISRLVKKANESADIQACRQMNTQLAVNEITEGKDILQVYTALAAGGMSAKDYKPLSSDTFYFWDSSLNRVLYTNEGYKVLYPEEYKTATPNNGWYSLTQEIPEKDYKIGTDGVVEITEAGQLVKLSNDKKSGLNENLTSKLKNNIDFMGASFHLDTGAHTVKLTADASSPVTIRGLVNTNYQDLSPNNAGELTSYGDSVIKGTNSAATITIENITFDGLSLGGSKSTDVALVSAIGGAGTGDKVTMNNVNIKNSTFIGKYRIAGFLAHVDGTVQMTNCSIENSNLTGSVGAVAPIFSMLTTKGNFTNVTVSSNVVVKCTNTNSQKFDKLTLENLNYDLKLPADGLMVKETYSSGENGYRWYPAVSSFGTYGGVGGDGVKAKDESNNVYTLASYGLDCVENITDANSYSFRPTNN